MSKDLHLLLLPEDGPTKKYRIKSYHLCGLKILPLVFLLLLALSVVGAWALWKNMKLHEEIKSLEKRLVRLEEENQNLRLQISSLEKERERWMASLLDKLKNRSQMLRDMVADLGLSKYAQNSQDIKVTIKGNPSKGGIFVPLKETNSLDEFWDKYEGLLTDMEAYLDILSKVPLGKPCRGYISSRFGRRKDPFTGKPAFHTGIDIVSYPGTPVKATAGGKVIYAGRHSGYGKVVLIRHSFGYSTLYGHLKKIKVRSGQKVKRGEIIGYLGNTGRSTGPHLHYEIRRYGRYLNPYKYLRLNLAQIRIERLREKER